MAPNKYKAHQSILRVRAWIGTFLSAFTVSNLIKIYDWNSMHLSIMKYRFQSYEAWLAVWLWLACRVVPPYPTSYNVYYVKNNSSQTISACEKSHKLQKCFERIFGLIDNAKQKFRENFRCKYGLVSVNSVIVVYLFLTPNDLRKKMKGV